MMHNHSARVNAARVLVKERLEPVVERLHLPLCVVDDCDRFLIHQSALGREVDCLGCLADMTRVACLAS